MKKFAKWLDNFWYHYKWHVIVTAFFVTFFGIATFQMFNKDKIDVNVLYTGPTVFSLEGIRDVESAFRQVMSEDYNGDGEKGVQLLDITLMTEDELRKAQADADADGMGSLAINSKAMSDSKKQFNNEIFAGESIICLLDPYWYETVLDSNGFMPLSEILGYKPENAIDDYGIKFRDTDFGRYFTCFEALPEDTVLCFRRMSTTSMFKSESKESSRYEAHKKMLADLLAFRIPEGWQPESAVPDETAQ